MRILVCVKQVPSGSQVRLDPETRTLIRDGRQSVLNPFDAYAVEEAVRIKERLGGTVTVMSMGIPSTRKLLLDAVARGADEAILLSDRAFAGADTLATSYTLAAGVRKAGGFSLILCGRMAVDGDTAQIGPELAEQLGIPHVTEVCRIRSLDEKKAVVERETGGFRQVLEVELPALFTVSREINQPRLPSIAGIRRSEETAALCWDAAALGTDPERTGLAGSPTQVVETSVPRREQTCRFLTGTAAQQAAAVLEIWRGEEGTACPD